MLGAMCYRLIGLDADWDREPDERNQDLEVGNPGFRV